ncbi:MAG: 30S ribosomal protein S20 [Fidelibacterota bacterium]|nr:MAG: 30S ribosomal protein S20 [Candidatus Neomarinimicrobiota bacterium]
MDRHKSTIKRHRQSLKRNERNRAAKSEIKTSIRKVQSAESKEVAETALLDAIKVIDKSAGAKVIHRNKAARLKAKLAQDITTRFTS